MFGLVLLFVFDFMLLMMHSEFIWCRDVANIALGIGCESISMKTLTAKLYFYRRLKIEVERCKISKRLRGIFFLDNVINFFRSLSSYLSICLSVCHPVSLYVSWYIDMSVCRSVGLSVCRSVGLLVCWSASL